MPKNAVIALLLAGLIALPLVAQERQKKASFPDALKAAGEAFEAKKFLACANHLKASISICMIRFQEAVIAARPKAPDGFEAVPVKMDQVRNPYAAGIAAAVGHEVKYQYRQTGGKGTMDVKVIADSIMAAAMEAQFRFAEMDPSLEVVKYGPHKALFQNKNGSLLLKILIAGKHYIEVAAKAISEEVLFATFSQAFVDQMAGLFGV